MAESLSATVVIAGAGTVGMSLAIELGLRGIDTLVLEPRPEGEPAGAKCNTVAARTLETFRRFGIADAVRAAGLPDDYPTDVIYCTSVAGYELTRIAMPSRSERALPGFIDSHWPTPEPVVRVSQLYLEPILYARLRASPSVRVLHGVRVLGYTQSAAQVEVACEAVDGTPTTVRGSYLVGCDGGRSTVRKAMGVQLVGDAELGRTRTTLVRAPALRGLFGDRRPTWMSWVSNPRVRGNVIAIDGRETWLLHRNVPPRATSFEALDFDESIHDLIGARIPFEVLSHEDWIGRRLVAERFRDGRVFIAGDAAHLWVPFAGYGMNAGIADAVSLAWLITAVERGWGAPAMLAAYEAERLPITDQVSRLAIGKVMENTLAVGAGPVPDVLEEASPEGDAARRALGERLRDINVSQFAPAGLNFGYYYDASPIIAYDGTPAPSYDMGGYTPSTVPGCRFPHAYLADGTSIYDSLGDDYTLVRCDPSVSVEALLSATHAAAVPITLLDVEALACDTALVLVRRDLHVAWRGAQSPQDPAALIARISGKAMV